MFGLLSRSRCIPRSLLKVQPQLNLARCYSAHAELDPADKKDYDAYVDKW